eukprot:scaffold28963_cov188-Skeletonema_marinoi.AAC.1
MKWIISTIGVLDDCNRCIHKGRCSIETTYQRAWATNIRGGDAGVFSFGSTCCQKDTSMSKEGEGEE